MPAYLFSVSDFQSAVAGQRLPVTDACVEPVASEVLFVNPFAGERLFLSAGGRVNIGHCG